MLDGKKWEVRSVVREPQRSPEVCIKVTMHDQVIAQSH